MGQINYTTERINNLLAKVDEQLDPTMLFKIRGKINLTILEEVKTAQQSLTSTNEVGIYLVTDSFGKIPSTEAAITIPSNVLKQLQLSSPITATNAILAFATNSVTLFPIGVSVGDIIAITRVKVAVSDLASALGISLSLSGEIEIYQYKLWCTNDVKAPSEDFVGAMGLCSIWDKTQINKVPNLETGKLNISDRLPTHNVWDSNMNECLNQGVYPWCLTGRPAGSADGTHYTLVVQKSSTADNSGYYTITQTCYGREGADYGKIFQRIFFRKDNGEVDWGKGWMRIDTDERADVLQQRLAGLQQGMSPFYYPFVSLEHIGGSSTSGTSETLNQMLNDLIDASKTPDRGGVFRALYNGSQIIIEQYAGSYAQDKFTQVVRGQFMVEPTNANYIKWDYGQFNILYRDHNITNTSGWSEWRAMPTAKTIASLEARIKALENK